MRVLQLIDSLRPGGAEQMAVAYANGLSRRGQESFLCCTRLEGLLKKRLEPEVGYLFLEKKHTLDWIAFKRLKAFVKEQKVELIHAHSSSFFLAVLVKLSFPGIKLVWHDHYGRDLGKRKDNGLKLMSRYFDGVISVSEALKSWALQNLKATNVVYIKNFLPNTFSAEKALELEGDAEIKIICVANLRPQKDHINLVKAFKLVQKEYPELSLHLVGKDENDAYSQDLKSFILEQNLQETIFLYGEQENVLGIVKQATIGVLSSSSEGLPVALLEYGHAEIPIVCTRVGEIPEVLNSLGQLVKAEDPRALAGAIDCYLKNEEKRKEDAFLFHKKVLQEFSEDAVLPNVLTFYRSVLRKK